MQWLATNQTKAGSWDGGDNGPGITGMCVMEFLASGEDRIFGRYSENIRRAVRSMIQSQTAATGFFGGNAGHSSMYHHGFAMLGCPRFMACWMKILCGLWGQRWTNAEASVSRWNSPSGLQ